MKKLFTTVIIVIILFNQLAAQNLAISDIKTTVEQFGKKVYSLQQNENINNYSLQYWVDGSTVKFYFEKYIEPNDGRAGEQTVFMSDGKILNGTAKENNLPNADNLMSNDNGNNSFEDETSNRNYTAINEKQYVVTMQNYTPKYSLNYKGKTMGPFSMPPYGITSKKSNSFFYIIPSATNATLSYNQFCADGKVVYDSKDSSFLMGGNIECSANGKYGAAVLTVNDAQGNGSIYVFASNGKRLPANNFGNQYHIMNSGQLLAQNKDNSENTVTYTIDGNTEIKMPEKTTSSIEFFSSVDANKWSSVTQNALYFSDSKAFAIKDKDGNAVNGIMPKKLTIENKDYLVWLTIYNNEVYLCKKEIN